MVAGSFSTQQRTQWFTSYSVNSLGSHRYSLSVRERKTVGGLVGSIWLHSWYKLFGFTTSCLGREPSPPWPWMPSQNLSIGTQLLPSLYLSRVLYSHLSSLVAQQTSYQSNNQSIRFSVNRGWILALWKFPSNSPVKGDNWSNKFGNQSCRCRSPPSPFQFA